MLSHLGMHAAFFGLKRAHHSVLRLGRHAFASMGLTAARFDLLFAVHAHNGRRMPQRELQRMLGVCRATVSRMLASLENLGLVRRTASGRDRRRKLVELTKEGRKRVRRVIRRLIRNGMARLALYTALGANEKRCAWFDGDACWNIATELQETLLDLRRTFGDSGDLDEDYVDAEIGYGD
jgi:DNA-binding MarR family transcriptional regulator